MRSLIYGAEDFTEVARDIDVVLESVGGDYADRSLRTLRRGGLLLTIVERTNAQLAARVKAAGRRFAGVIVEPDSSGLEKLAEWADSGRLRVHVEEVFPTGGSGAGSPPAGRRRQREAGADALRRSFRRTRRCTTRPCSRGAASALEAAAGRTCCRSHLDSFSRRGRGRGRDSRGTLLSACGTAEALIGVGASMIACS